MKPQLLILAAGMGSRYQGLKQLDGFGPAGETLMEYSLYDAQKAGFSKVVFVIQESFAEAFRQKIALPYSKLLETEVVYQSIDRLPPGAAPVSDRTKPWGTGHAVWCAQKALSAPFAVINADDFYGSQSFQLLADFLSPQDSHSPEFALAAYRLKQTLSEQNPVNRGIVQHQAGRVTGIEEAIGLKLVNHQAQDEQGRVWPLDSPVSMNCWGFSLKLFTLLEQEFSLFLKTQGREQNSEFFLPAVVDQALKTGAAQVSLLQSPESWIGVTHRADRARAKKALAQRVQRGDYPSPLL